MIRSGIRWLWAGQMVFFLSAWSLHAANPAGVNQVYEIPFEYKNHFILIKLTFQNVLPLTFIFDTGAETTLLTSLEIANLLDLTYEREIQIVGADLEAELSAFLVRNIHIQLGDVALPYQSILVLEEDVFHFNEYTGTQVHGILGSSTFRQFIVEIDYEDRLIRLYRPSDFRAPRNSERLDLEIHRSKPYLSTTVKPANGDEVSIKLLVDSGASLAMVIHPETNPNLSIPEKVVPGNIGMGLGGNLQGVLGIMPTIHLGKTQLHDVPVHFQEIRSMVDSVFLNNRNGILGNKVLERYTATFDYYRGVLYLQPNRLYKKEFPIDKSGMLVIASGPELKTFMVHAVLKESPAAKAGVRPGDIIVSINYSSFRFFDLDAIYRVLSRPEGKLIRLKLDRKGLKFRTEFRLEKLL
ncbi:MAG: aspartyl protease family protein [Saprospirales bacterium]|nr:aspartyl protease family protein [Saprospirales bacterium]